MKKIVLLLALSLVAGLFLIPQDASATTPRGRFRLMSQTPKVWTGGENGQTYEYRIKTELCITSNPPPDAQLRVATQKRLRGTQDWETISYQVISCSYQGTSTYGFDIYGGTMTVDTYPDVDDPDDPHENVVPNADVRVLIKACSTPPPDYVYIYEVYDPVTGQWNIKEQGEAKVAL